MHFILDILLGDIHLFKSKKERILHYEISIIEEKENPGMKLFPDPKKTAIANLFTLIQKGYFTKDQLKNALDLSAIEGVFPEVDWTLFNIHEDKTIYDLLKYRTYKEIRETFAKTKKEEKILDSWLINQAMADRINFKDK